MPRARRELRDLVRLRVADTCGAAFGSLSVWRSDPVHTIGAFAVILNEASHVLLCHRTDKDLWNLPGGRVEPDETPWGAVAREVLEEVGLVVAVQRLLRIYAVPRRRDVVFSFLCSITGGELRTSDEADSICWFNAEALPENTSRRHVERIRDALIRPGELVMKAQA